jgi:hypothetical protein
MKPARHSSESGMLFDMPHSAYPAAADRCWHQLDASACPCLQLRSFAANNALK